MFLTPDTHCVYQGMRNVRFSKKVCELFSLMYPTKEFDKYRKFFEFFHIHTLTIVFRDLSSAPF